MSRESVLLLGGTGAIPLNALYSADLGVCAPLC